MDVGSLLIFDPSDEETCINMNIAIAPANGTAGIWVGSECSQSSYTTSGSGAFKIRGCEEGSVTVTVSEGSTVIQSIAVSVTTPNR